MMTRFFFYSTTLLLISTFFFPGCLSEPPAAGSPVEPEQAVRTLQLADDGLKIELFVSEPLITDPVAMEVDERGRIYVVEMPGYPLDTEGSGRIKLLHDTNQDGFPDRATVFADGLVFPKGIMRWKEGILVTDAPHLYYLEDSTGDGKADIREVLLTGFARSNPQHNFNKPLYGLDNWIYLANGGTIHTELFADELGDSGSEILFPEYADSPVLPVNGGDKNIRFRPEEPSLEMLSTSSQFGQDFDQWGRHFLISNATHHFHEAIAARYADRNPDLQIRSAIHHTPVHGNAADVYPVTRNPMHQLLTDVGVFTSASGITFYSGDLFGQNYRNVSFVTEPQHNLVHSDIVSEKGSVFESKRQFEGAEFLASTDSWFRPVNLYHGPDGALYVIDYYRQIIEHPEWMDEETFQTLDLYAGIDRGRIYRITPNSEPAADWIGQIPLPDHSTDQLVHMLGHENIWWRRHSQRLLADRKPADAAELLKEFYHQSDHPMARLHALWTLDGLDSLETEMIRNALLDEDPGIRENAIRLAELHTGDDPSLAGDLLKMETDSSARVQFQLLLTLGYFDDPGIREARDRILFNHIEDNWFQIAALSSPFVRSEDMLDQTIRELAGRQTAGRENYFQHVGSIIAAGNSLPQMQDLLRKTAGTSDPDAEWWQSAVLRGFADQIQRSDADPRQIAGEQGILVERFFSSETTEFRNAAIRMLEVIGESGTFEESALGSAVSIIRDREADDSFRADAIRLIGIRDASVYKDLLYERIDPSEPGIIQRTALQVLARIPGEDIGEFVLDRWERMTPQVRDQAVNVLITEPARINLLLDAVEEGNVFVSTIGWPRRVSLMRDRGGDEGARALRDRARELLRRDPAARRQVINQYEAALDHYQADTARGREVFTTTCGTCHQIGGELGVAFGPDAGTFQHWSRQALLTKILDPDRSVADGYNLWMIQRNSGEVVSGVMAGETDQSVTLREPTGREIIIPRSDIESISASATSPMPEGLEQQIDEQDMTNLIEFIRTGGR